MMEIKDFTDVPVQMRPRAGRYGWISKVCEFGETGMVLLYGTHIVGRNFYGPEYNGIAVFHDYLPIRTNIARESSGYYGPSEKQLFIFGAICEMGEMGIYQWAKDGCPDIPWKKRSTCPTCGNPLTCDVHLVNKNTPLYKGLRGELTWNDIDLNDVTPTDLDYIYCEACDEEVEV